MFDNRLCKSLKIRHRIFIFSLGRSSKIQTHGETTGPIDFHSAMPEYKSVAAGVAVAFAAAKNGIG